MARSSVWANRDFGRLWAAGTISIFGSLVTRYALPFAAIEVASAGPFQIAVLRALDLVGVLLVGLVAGAWVDRLRRRPIMVVADLGRAVLLGSIPVAAIAGVLSLAQLFAVAFLAAILSTFFDSADRAFLPTIVERDELISANSALTASASAAEFSAFGVSGVLVQLFSAPIAIAVDAASFVASALFIGSIRRPEPARPPVEAREPVLREIREGIRLVRASPVLRALTGATGAAHLLWGVFGTSYILFATEVVGVGPAALGIIAGVGGASSLIGAVVAGRATRRFGLGPSLIGGMVLFTIGNAFIPLAPSGAVAVGAACLILQQFVADGGYTVYDIAEVSLRQSIVDDRLMGRVTATVNVFTGLVQLVGTIAGGLIAAAFGLRTGLALGLVGGVIATAFLWFSPVRTLRGGMPAPIDRALLPGGELPVTE
jgi:MFS family permease